MLRYIGVLCLSLFFHSILLSQEITATHTIQETEEPNEYTIKTSISGLSGVDIARITYFIPKEHTFKKSPNNALFHKREDAFVKFYIMGVPPSGTMDIELGVLLSTGESVEFPVEFQYSKNEEKKVMKLAPLKIDQKTDIVVENTLEEENREEKEIIEEEEDLQPLDEGRLALEKVVERKREEERLAKEKAAEEEKVRQEAELLAKQQAEQEKIAQEKAEEEKRLVEEEKVRQEAELLAKQQKEEERKAQELAKQEEKERQEAELLAVQQAEEEKKAQDSLAEASAAEKAKQEAELLAKQQEEERKFEEEAVEEKFKQEDNLSQPSLSTAKYAVQLLALSNYSEQKVADFCSKKGLSMSKISTEKVGGLTKVRYGTVSSIEEAKELREEMLQKNIPGVFIVTIN